jgi:hypothetical protein
LERRKEFGRSTFERELRTARKKHETPEEYARWTVEASRLVPTAPRQTMESRPTFIDLSRTIWECCTWALVRSDMVGSASRYVRDGQAGTARRHRLSGCDVGLEPSGSVPETGAAECLYRELYSSVLLLLA